MAHQLTIPVVQTMAAAPISASSGKEAPTSPARVPISSSWPLTKGHASPTAPAVSSDVASRMTAAYHCYGNAMGRKIAKTDQMNRMTAVSVRPSMKNDARMIHDTVSVF